MNKAPEGFAEQIWPTASWMRPKLHGFTRTASFAVQAWQTVNLERGFSCSRSEKVEFARPASRELALSEVEGAAVPT
jgi:hypothetical protein